MLLQTKLICARQTKKLNYFYKVNTYSSRSFLYFLMQWKDVLFMGSRFCASVHQQDNSLNKFYYGGISHELQERGGEGEEQCTSMRKTVMFVGV